MFGRRDALRLAALVPVAAALTAGCSPANKEPDPLEALRLGAATDSALAQAVAAAYPAVAEQAKAIAVARDQHAAGLQREIDRVNPPDPDKKGRSAAAPPPQQAPPSASQAKATLTDSLRTAQRRAAELVPSLPAYRAGLVGSVSASCASLLEVLA
jgi:hypothetical protein